jgi:hypothetical protein
MLATFEEEWAFDEEFPLVIGIPVHEGNIEFHLDDRSVWLAITASIVELACWWHLHLTVQLPSFEIDLSLK